MCSVEELKESMKYTNHSASIGYRSHVSYSPTTRSLGLYTRYEGKGV